MDQTNTYWPDAVARQAAVLKEQAEQIERLRAALTAMGEAKLVSQDAFTEIKRLRAALSKIRNKITPLKEGDIWLADLVDDALGRERSDDYTYPGGVPPNDQPRPLDRARTR